MTEKGLSLRAPVVPALDPGPVAADSRWGLVCSPVTGLCCSHGPSHLPEHADQGQGRGHSLGPQGPSRDYGGVKPSLFSVRADSSKLCGPRGLRCGDSTWPPPRRIRHRPHRKRSAACSALPGLRGRPPLALIIGTCVSHNRGAGVPAVHCAPRCICS